MAKLNLFVIYVTIRLMISYFFLVEKV